MSLRISSLSALALLAGCSGAGDSGDIPPPPPGREVDCAIGAGAALSPVCSLEQAGNDVIIHHPDGGFRRLARDPATGTLTPRDGADPLVSEGGGEGAVAFAIGADRYSIPLRLLAPAPK
ncbi:hypothetical protein [Porphyrobacter sp. TH134]|uniref:hypothetical protein n=1 Tax=Porphyrobacter sp. TH134 TaxID=2067450 RepID=UPI00117EE884|nr:hypothetical protein [Porphyrobacter sp. TH134]